MIPSRLTQLIPVVLILVFPIGCGVFPGGENQPESTSDGSQTADHSDAEDNEADAESEAERLAREAEEYAQRIEGAESNPVGSTGNANAGRSVLDVRPNELTRTTRPDPAVAREPADDPPRAPVDDSASQGGEPPADHAVEPEATSLTQEQLLARLRRTLADGDGGDLRPLLQRAALAAVDPSEEITAAQVRHLPESHRELVLGYQRLFTEIAMLRGGDPAEQRQDLETAVQELHEALALSRPFEIATLQLCRKVNGFGVYEPFKQTTFLVGRKHPVIVYAELENFHTERQDEQHVVRLKQEVILYNDADGLPVWRQRPETIVDRSRNRRRDFFVVQLIHLSERLSVGKYQLKVRITDEVGQEVDEQSIPITIVADPQLTEE